MAWRKPTLADLAATLSQTELDQFRQSPDVATGVDPIEDLLSRTAALVRSYCRTNIEITISPVAGEIPESMISPAMDYAAYDVLKRLRVEVAEDRRRARDQAIALFDKVAEDKVTPESYGIAEGEYSYAKPKMTTPPWPRTLF